VAGQWQVEQLDSRNGSVLGSNAAGDLAGYVYYLPCASTDGCQHAAIWNADGSFEELGTLGGKDSWARGINASGEVVGNSTANSVNTGFLWSQSLGMIKLPFNGSWAAANGVSDVRADATRLVAGMSSRAAAIVWVVRNP
jgi:probable HAF family extracellular repeat protein